MTRIDTVASSADDIVGLLEQKSVSAVSPPSALNDGKESAQMGRRLGDTRTGADGMSGQGDSGSVHVDLSGAGKAMAAGSSRSDRNADIDESGLPDQVKDLLKRIREIREELGKKQAQLRAAMADTRMRPEQRKMKVSMLQGEIAVLSSSLVLASNTLAKLISELKLSPDQAATAAQLMTA